MNMNFETMAAKVITENASIWESHIANMKSQENPAMNTDKTSPPRSWVKRVGTSQTQSSYIIKIAFGSDSGEEFLPELFVPMGLPREEVQFHLNVK
jgi:hypothetical protein